MIQLDSVFDCRSNLRRAVSLLPVAALLTSAPFVSADENVNQTGLGSGVLIDTQRESCGTLQMNGNGSYENAYGVRHGFFSTDIGGTFAECFVGPANVCGMVFDLTTIDDFGPGATFDATVWDDAGGVPGQVLCLIPEIDPYPVAFWPSISRHTVTFPVECCVSGNFWVGHRANWGNLPTPFFWYIGADLDGFGGCPKINCSPESGYPSGWQDVSIVWGPTAALGIGCETTVCSATPIEPSSWGRVKGLYR